MEADDAWRPCSDYETKRCVLKGGRTMRRTATMLIVMVIGAGLTGVPAAFAMENENGGTAPGAPLYKPSGPIAQLAVPAAANGISVGRNVNAVSGGHAESK